MDWMLRQVSSIFDITAAKNASLSFPPPDLLSHFYLQIVACLLKSLLVEAPSCFKWNKALPEESTCPHSSLSGVFFCPSLSLWDEGAETVGIFQALHSYFHIATVSLSLMKTMSFTIYQYTFLLYLLNFSLSVTFFKDVDTSYFSLSSTILHFLFLLKAALIFCFVFLVRGQYHHTSR